MMLVKRIEALVSRWFVNYKLDTSAITKFKVTVEQDEIVGEILFIPDSLIANSRFILPEGYLSFDQLGAVEDLSHAMRQVVKLYESDKY